MIVKSRFGACLRGRLAGAVLLLVATVSGCATLVDVDVARRFQTHVDYLASDELAGRGVGTPGIQLAADYVAEQFKQAGLEPGGDKGGYFQAFEMAVRRRPAGTSKLAFSTDRSAHKGGLHFTPMPFSSTGKFAGDVVFCGYGIDSDEHNHHDFAHLDLTGKVALMFRGQPVAWSKDSGAPSRHASFRSKVYNAKDRDAVAVIMVNQTPAEGETDKLVEFNQNTDDYGIPVFHIQRSWLSQTLRRGGLPTLDELQTKLDAGSFVSAPLEGTRAKGKSDIKEQRAVTYNVVGLLRGAGAHADEFIVIGAHYDHLGIQKSMKRTFKDGKLVYRDLEPEIHNGADDNASGTSGLIEIARSLAAGPKLGRSVVFVAFSAEERGVLGSKYYVEHPAAPNEKVVVMLNMDMIGRLDPSDHEVQVFGVHTGAPLEKIVKAAARRAGIKAAPSPGAGGGSDHTPFLGKQIPSLHFFTGQHADYHAPGDDADKINAEGGARVAGMVGDIARRIAALDTRFAFVKPEVGKAEPGATPTYRVVMGLAPGYGDDGTSGMKVDAVTPQGPADMAGMKAGDHIIRIGGKEVRNIYDYMSSTRNDNPGDTVEVVVVRDGKEITLRVKLSGAG